MKISGLPVDVSFGDADQPADWRKHREEHPELDPHEDEDSEDATDEEKAFAKATLGFDSSQES